MNAMLYAVVGAFASMFFMSKSENKNQVHYGIHVDESCSLVGSAPLYGYWRMFEKSPDGPVEPLLDREQRAYGIETQSVSGNTVRVTLRALPTRPLTVRVGRAANGSCEATAETVVDGHSAALSNIYIKLGFLHVDQVVLTGLAADGHVVRESLKP